MKCVINALLWLWCVHQEDSLGGETVSLEAVVLQIVARYAWAEGKSLSRFCPECLETLPGLSLTLDLYRSWRKGRSSVNFRSFTCWFTEMQSFGCQEKRSGVMEMLDEKIFTPAHTYSYTEMKKKWIFFYCFCANVFSNFQNTSSFLKILNIFANFWT